jgi:hypothetical protein
MIRVGSNFISEKTNKYKVYSYTHVEYDYDGWADSKKYLPMLFDLCLLKLENGQTKAGWSTGPGWDGKNVLPDDRVLYWKRKTDYEWDKPHQYHVAI